MGVRFFRGPSYRRSSSLLLALVIGFLSVGQHAFAAASGLVLSPGQVSEASSPLASSTTPADGRLRGPDFSATVTGVSWPQSVASPSGGTYVAGTGHRLVAFTLSVTQASADAGVGNAPTGVAAKLTDGATSKPVSMSAIDQQIAGGRGGSAQTTGTDSFVASVPAHEHDVALTLGEAGFSQSFDLWTLVRIPPSPALLYRDPSSSTLTGIAAGPFHVSFANSADGFSSSDDAQVQSATLSYFAPGSSGTPSSNPDDAFLTLGIQSSYPDVPYGQPDSGHFFSGFSPLSGTQLTFTPSGGSAVSATADTADFSSTNAASDDDGLFDAVYSFVVPASTSSGTLNILPGTASGTEYTGFTGTGTTVPIAITSPSSVALSFPAVTSAPPAQKAPPWVNAPLPPTGSAAAPAEASASLNGSGSSGGSSGGGGPSIWLVVLILVLVATGVVAFQRFRRRPAPAMATPSAVAETVPASRDIDDGEHDPQSSAESEAVPEPLPVSVPKLVPQQEPLEQATRSLVLGPPCARGLKHSDRRIIEELFHYLALHDSHRRNAEQILVALRPNPDPEDDLTLKTIRTYLSELRSCVGVEHLPNAAVAGGYLVEDVSSDWGDFQNLTRRADTTSGAEARALRREALSLVRGVPFAGVVADTYQWVGAEYLVSTMTTAIARCASRLSSDLLEACDAIGAEDAARAGLRCAPHDFDLWRLLALAIDRRGDRSALRLWKKDAIEALEPVEIARIEEELGPHPNAPEDVA